MRKKIYRSLLTLTIMLAVVMSASAQAKGTVRMASASAIPNPLAALPASDAVMFVDVQRLLNEAVPRALASDPTRLAQVNADIDQFKARTGIDARSFENIAVGVRYVNASTGLLRLESVALAHGSFNAGAFVAAGRLATKGAYQEEKYGDRTISIFSLNEPVKMFGMLKMPVHQLAATALDANTLAVGDPAGVRAAIDANMGRGRISPALAALATRNPNALIGFGGNMPPAAVQKLDFGNEEISKSISSIRQLYGSLGTSATGFNMLAVFRTDSPNEAKNLNDTIAAVQQFAPFLASQLSGDRGKLAQNAINSLKISLQGNEVQVGLELTQTDLTTLLRIF